MHTYTLTRKRNGLEAKTVIPMEGNRRLWITTSKGSRGLWTSASVIHEKSGGIITHVFGGAEGDFSESVRRDPKARATEKAIRTMHEDALRDADRIVVAATMHYASLPEDKRAFLDRE